MVYESFDALLKEYPEREEQSFEEECCFVADLFDTYEHFGFSETYHSPYESEKKYNRKPFRILRRLSYSDGEADLGCLPMWKIRFEDGMERDAYPEEICKVEMSTPAIPDFSSEEEMRKDPAMQSMHRNDHRKVRIDGKECVAVGTIQQIEDLIWGKLEELSIEIKTIYGMQPDTDDIAVIRDAVYNGLKEAGIRFVPVSENY